MTLKDIQAIRHYSTDKQEPHHYLDIYDPFFAPFKDKEALGVFEVGYATGGSIRLWEEYFTYAHIYCVDINDTAFGKHSDRVKLDKKDINELTSDWFDTPIDIAIDDGSHNGVDSVAFLKLMYPLVREGGMLIVEDIDDIEGGKRFFDPLNIPYIIVDLNHINNWKDSVLFIFLK